MWYKLNDIFLDQGNYVLEILKRFEMMDCKPMHTLMVGSMKLLSDTSADIIDATMYGQMNCLLMYLTIMRQDICFAVNTLS